MSQKDKKKKFSELDKDKRQDLYREVANAATMLGADEYDDTIGTGGSRLDLEDTLGICATCHNLEFARTEFNNIHAACEYYRIKLTGQSRMVDCNKYKRVGEMDLRDMWALAWIIDPDAKGRIKGFGK